MKAIYDQEMNKLQWLGALKKTQVGRRISKLPNLYWHHRILLSLFVLHQLYFILTYIYY